MLKRLFQWIQQRLGRRAPEPTHTASLPGSPAPAAPPPIASRPTAVTAFVGPTATGPVDAAVSVTSVSEYTTRFGAVADVHPVSRAVEAFFLQGGTEAVVVRVQPADDTAPSFAAAVTGDAATPAGLHALDDRIGLLCVPPPALGLAAETPRAAYQQAAARCADLGAVLLMDPPPAWAEAAQHQQWGQIDPAYFALGSYADHAAVYFPRLPAGSPPLSGAVAGVIARTDAQRGVWKAPAGRAATLTGATGLSVTPSEALFEALNPRGINGLRMVPGSGVTVWGARTLRAATASDALRYLPVFRLRLHLADSLWHGLPWVAEAPNTDALWQQVRTAVRAFMQALYRQGAFAGATPDEAYFVQCGRGTTMTDADVAAGRMRLLVGFAPLKPAEFVILDRTFSAAQP